MEPMLVVEIVRWVGAAAVLGRKRRKAKSRRDSQCCMAVWVSVLVSCFFLGGESFGFWFSLPDLIDSMAERILSKFSECLSSFASMEVLSVLWESLRVLISAVSLVLFFSIFVVMACSFWSVDSWILAIF